MKMTLLALAAMLFCASQIHASLGDTETDLAKRYGPNVGKFISDTGKFTTEEYEFQNYHISVVLLDGVCARETFNRKDGKALDAIELKILLDGNALGSKWIQKDDTKDMTIWVLESKEAFAGYYKSLFSFTVKTNEMLAMEEALVKYQQQQAGNPSAKPKGTPNRNLQP
jgi:hypothetical protein